MLRTMSNRATPAAQRSGAPLHATRQAAGVPSAGSQPFPSPPRGRADGATLGSLPPGGDSEGRRPGTPSVPMKCPSQRQWQRSASGPSGRGSTSNQRQRTREGINPSPTKTSRNVFVQSGPSGSIQSRAPPNEVWRPSVYPSPTLYCDACDVICVNQRDVGFLLAMSAMVSVFIREIRVPFVMAAMVRRSEASDPEATQKAGAPGRAPQSLGATLPQPRFGRFFHVAKRNNSDRYGAALRVRR